MKLLQINKKIARIKKHIDRYNYISFDVFDTLVKRDSYQPTEVFKLVERRIDHTFGLESHFSRIRIKAEKEAIVSSKKEEITLDEIYKFIDLGSLNSKLNTIKQWEQDFEYNLCQWNPLIKPVYDYCVLQKKKILIITDIYLPQELIIKILAKLNITYDALFVSSFIGKRKSRGSLFRYALKKMELKPSQVLHIGDNIKSDYLIPKTLGIHSIKLDTKAHINLFVDNKTYKENSYYANLCAFINSHSPNHSWDAINPKEEEDYFSQAGYETEGPVLYGFVKWLRERVERDKIEKIFFLARDGQIMEKAFERVSNSIPHQYLFASRRALIVPTLWMNPELSNISDSMFLPLYISIKSLFSKMGLNYHKYEKIFTENGFSFYNTYNCHNLITDRNFRALYDEYVKADVILNSKNQYELLKRYLGENDFKGNVAIVDIGWFGHMQVALQKVVKSADIPAKITGYYVGLTPISNLLDQMNAYGYLFDKGKNEKLAEIEATFNSIVEVLFTANHGTTLGYKMENRKIIPVLDNWEYEKDPLKSDYKWIKSAQEGALAFIDDINSVAFDYFPYTDAQTSFINWIQMGCYPSKKCAELFGNLHFLDDGIQTFAIHRKISDYLLKPQNLIHDFVSSVWRVGFLTRTFGPSPLWFYLYRQIRRSAHALIN